MALTLVLANKAYSSWSMRPWMVLKHFDIPFDEIVIPMNRAGNTRRNAQTRAERQMPVAA